MLRSSRPIKNHDGSSRQSGRSPDGSVRASCVAGRCVAAIVLGADVVDGPTVHTSIAVGAREASLGPHLDSWPTVGELAQPPALVRALLDAAGIRAGGLRIARRAIAAGLAGCSYQRDNCEKNEHA